MNPTHLCLQQECRYGMIHDNAKSRYKGGFLRRQSPLATHFPALCILPFETLVLQGGCCYLITKLYPILLQPQGL